MENEKKEAQRKLIKERDHLGRYFELEKDKIEESPF